MSWSGVVDGAGQIHKHGAGAIPWTGSGNFYDPLYRYKALFQSIPEEMNMLINKDETRIRPVVTLYRPRKFMDHGHLHHEHSPVEYLKSTEQYEAYQFLFRPYLYGKILGDHTRSSTLYPYMRIYLYGESVSKEDINMGDLFIQYGNDNKIKFGNTQKNELLLDILSEHYKTNVMIPSCEAAIRETLQTLKPSLHGTQHWDAHWAALDRLIDIIDSLH